VILGLSKTLWTGCSVSDASMVAEESGARVGVRKSRRQEGWVTSVD